MLMKNVEKKETNLRNMIYLTVVNKHLISPQIGLYHGNLHFGSKVNIEGGKKASDDIFA